MINQNDARNFLLTLNSIAGYVPPLQFQAVVNNPVAMTLQNVANGFLELTVKTEEPKTGEAGPVGPHLVRNTAETGEAG